MAVKIDKLTLMSKQSIRKFLFDNLTGFFGVFFGSVDFNYDKKSDGTNRVAPFIVITVISDSTLPFEVGNKRVERNIEFEVEIVCEDALAMLTRPQQVLQLMMTAKEDGIDGAIPLLDFDPVTPVKVDHIELIPSEITPFPDFTKKEEWDNLKFTQVLSLRISEEKVKEAKLLA